MTTIKKAGPKVRSMIPPPLPKRESSPEVEYVPPPPEGPRIWIEVPVPELNGVAVGTEFDIVGKVRLTGIEQRKRRKGSIRHEYTLELLEMGVR